uniref:Uncharacterized protein n=1 Tax=Arundo donax TaxID=35708 RepID=A0A0A9DHV4_ARUDO
MLNAPELEMKRNMSTCPIHVFTMTDLPPANCLKHIVQILQKIGDVNCTPRRKAIYYWHSLQSNKMDVSVPKLHSEIKIIWQGCCKIMYV